eukprot:maker-scaffold_2-snap-gene-6.51-mRNA-1 protein AED:0.02 eAED:0.02 QI:18/1/1/1/1/1/6/205/493
MKNVKLYLNLSLSILFQIIMITKQLNIEYAIQIDAGSSGTRAFIFEKQIKQEKIELQTNPDLIYETTPIFSQSNAVSVLQEIIQFCKLTLEQRSSSLNLDKLIKTIPLFFGATAGIRRLNYDVRTKIIESVESTLFQSGFYIQDKSWIRILSGKEEASFAWLSVNYLLRINRSSRNSSVAVLDIGGASIQLAFETQKNIVFDRFETLTENGKTVLYAKSFQNLGINQAWSSFYTFSRANSSCYIFNLNFEICLDQTKEFLSTQTIIFEDQTVSLTSFYFNILRADVKIYGISYVQYLFEFFKCSQNLTLLNIKNIAQEVCSITKSSYENYVQSLGEGFVLSAYKDRFCFGAAYVLNLVPIITGRKLEDSTLFLERDPLQFHRLGRSFAPSSDEQVPVSWSYGSVLYHLQELDQTFLYTNQENIQLETSVSNMDFTLLVFLQGIVLGVLCGFCGSKWNTGSLQKRGYSFVKSEPSNSSPDGKIKQSRSFAFGVR